MTEGDSKEHLTPKFVGGAAGRMVTSSLRLETREEEYMLGKEEGSILTM